MLFVSLLILFFVKSCHQFPMSISYCDGRTVVNMTSDQCPYGINFGNKKPSCVCINGIYRLWMDGCAVYDGFMAGGCTTLSQEEWEVQGIRLTGSIDSLTTSTAAIFGLKETDYQIWTTYGIGERARTFTDNFYTLNGQPFFIDSPDKSICIEKIERPKFCRYFRNEQNNLWALGSGDIEIGIQEKCPSGKELIEQSCYETIQPSESECSLSCAGNGNLIDLTPKITPKNETTLDEDSDPTDCEPPTINEISHSTNNFLNRKLNQYAKLRQVKLAMKPNHREVKPIRTFSLLDIMKQITKKTCPPNYVSPGFLERGVDLFIILHKGQDYRYIEDLSEANFEWISQILHECNKEISALPLFSEGGVSGCQDSEKVTGVCIPNFENNGTKTSCEKIPIKLNFEHSSFKHHYVVDAVWNMLDIVQIVCFPYFAQSYRMFHSWEQNLEKLFTREIRKLWYNPGVATTRIYQNILAPTAVIDMYNLEMCVEGAYAVNPLLTRLLRPPVPRKFFRKKRDTTTEPLDVFCQKEEKDFQYPC